MAMVVMMCERCGHRGEVARALLESGRRARCTRCAGTGREAASPPTGKGAPPIPGGCMRCGKEIRQARLNAHPEAKHCITCAEVTGSGAANRHVRESWGSRADWSRDRNSWKRPH